MDGEGKFLKMLECPGSPGSAVLCTGRLPDGELLFEATDSDSGDVVIFCLRDGKERVLHKGQNIGAELRYIDNYGRVSFCGTPHGAAAGGSIRTRAL